MGNIFFNPAIGNDYMSGGFFNKRILVLGERFHCTEKREKCERMCHKNGCSEFATDVINRITAGEKCYWTGAFRRFEHAISGRTTTNDDSKKIWSSIVFSNYVQEAMGSAKEVPSAAQFKNAEIPFFKLLELVRPDAIITWGKRLFKVMPGGENYTKTPDIIVDDCRGCTGIYRLADQTEIPILWINNPASAFSCDKWHRVINTFLGKQQITINI